MVAMKVSVVSGIGSIEDTVEPSPAGIAISRSEIQSQLRSARVSEIRAEINAGTFMTAERVDGTVERLLKLLG
jgi:hypothetical protein